ncbi:hypothetical protein [Christiangramia sabulilitoris]|uniref:Uncharacterized protein n=1 Tax=Christiangramia sabulilitoris TaxID=2583991 RepID=A0A550I7D2_9FLAO|nr:hypothetical protein [Christiangramia sabulilitoris]TRO66882.1 hypothetical protein FGM01_03035 [Christiangramia sabulilitoris]
MKHNIKVFLIYFISFITIFSIFRYLISYIFPELRHLYMMISAAVITLVLSPRLDKDQNGRYILRSLFLKKPLIK